MKLNTGQVTATADVNAKAAHRRATQISAKKGQPAGPAKIVVAEGSANGDKGGCAV